MKNKKFFALTLTALISVLLLTGCYAGAIDNPEYTVAPNGSTVIDTLTAKRAALSQAKLENTDIVFDKIELDRDDGKEKYEVEFVYNGYKYEIDIDAADGSIIDYEKIAVNGNSNASTPATEPAAEPIGEDAALSAALARAGLNVKKDQLSVLEIKRERGEYEIDFTYNGCKYEIDVDEATGEILSFEQEEPVSLPESMLAKEEILKIALEHAKLTKADIQNLHMELDLDDSSAKYEVEFVYGYAEYDYDIDAFSGKILSFDRDCEHCHAPEYSKPDESKLIGKGPAKQVAFDHAGVHISDCREIEVELDIDNGVYKYEVEFKCGGYEYDYEIDAFSGEVLRFEKEIDD